VLVAVLGFAIEPFRIDPYQGTTSESMPENSVWYQDTTSIVPRNL